MLETIINTLSNTSINGWVMGSPYLWPAFEIAHFFGLSLLMGGLLIIDLGLIGVLKNMSVNTTHKLLRLVLIGFVINLITGILFIIGDPGRYLINIGFQIKMFLMFLAGLNAIWYSLSIARKVDLDADFVATGKSKMIGLASLVLWFGVLACGRLIPYVGTG